MNRQEIERLIDMRIACYLRRIFAPKPEGASDWSDKSVNAALPSTICGFSVETEIVFLAVQLPLAFDPAAKRQLVRGNGAPYETRLRDLYNPPRFITAKTLGELWLHADRVQASLSKIGIKDFIVPDGVIALILWLSYPYDGNRICFGVLG